MTALLTQKLLAACRSDVSLFYLLLMVLASAVTRYVLFVTGFCSLGAARLMCVRVCTTNESPLEYSSYNA